MPNIAGVNFSSPRARCRRYCAPEPPGGRTAVPGHDAASLRSLAQSAIVNRGSAVPPPGSLRLPDGEVHLWYEVPDAARDDLWREAAQRIATDAERARCERFVFPQGRRECLAARCMARSILSRYTDVHPSEWRFGSNRFGRPEITEPAHATQLRFNLSHADGLVACVVSAHYDVGVDVERFGRLPSMQLAESRFAASEVAALRALPDAEQARRFLEDRTLKEAYVKARGFGPRGSARSICVRPQPPRPPANRVSARVRRRPSSLAVRPALRGNRSPCSRRDPTRQAPASQRRRARVRHGATGQWSFVTTLASQGAPA